MKPIIIALTGRKIGILAKSIIVTDLDTKFCMNENMEHTKALRQYSGEALKPLYPRVLVEETARYLVKEILFPDHHVPQ